MVSDEDNIFVTSIDAYFATKSSTIPVKCEIRRYVINGYPVTQY